MKFGLSVLGAVVVEPWLCSCSTWAGGAKDGATDGRALKASGALSCTTCRTPEAVLLAVLLGVYMYTYCCCIHT